MAQLRGLDKSLYTIPQAQLYFRPDGSTKFYDLGSAESVEIEINVTDEEIFNNNGPTRFLDAKIAKEVRASVSMTLDHQSNFNRAAALSSDVNKVSRTAAQGKTKSITGVTAGDIYFLDDHKVENVTISDGAGTVDYTIGTDAIVDQDAGSVQIVNVPDTADPDLTITYDTVELTDDLRADVGSNPQLRGELRIRGTQKYGPKGLVTLHIVELRPSGGRGYVSDSKQSIQLEGEVLRDDTQPDGQELGTERAL